MTRSVSSFSSSGWKLALRRSWSSKAVVFVALFAVPAWSLAGVSPCADGVFLAVNGVSPDADPVSDSTSGEFANAPAALDDSSDDPPVDEQSELATGAKPNQDAASLASVVLPEAGGHGRTTRPWHAGQDGCDWILDEQVDSAVKEATAFLYSAQRNGRWISPVFEQSIPDGLTALVAYTLASVGKRPFDQRLALTANRLQDRSKTTTIFARSFTLLLWRRLAPEHYWREIDEDIVFLSGHQNNEGAWGFGVQPDEAHGKNWRDQSHSQIALMALSEAAGGGSNVRGTIWTKAERSWLQTQNEDGGWGFPIGNDAATAPELSDSYGTMTAAGLASLQSIYDRLYLEAELRFNGKFKARCGQDVEKTRAIRQSARRGWNWLNVHYRADKVPELPPGVTGELNETFWTYYLHCLARAGNGEGLRLIGNERWYDDIARHLVQSQQADGSWGSVHETCYALLALLEARKPLLVSKLEFGRPTSWNNDPRDMANLTAEFNRQLGKSVTWQVVNFNDAPRTIAEAPVLYITGHNAPTLGENARTALRDHVWSGGSIVGVACCSKEAFVEQFTTAMKEVFPMFKEGPLPEDHPLWTMHNTVEPGTDVIGLSDSCRTPVLILTNGACCAWHQNRVEDQRRLFDLGVNVLAYASYGLELPHRFAIGPVATERPAFRTISVARLRHGGDWWSSLHGLRQLSERLSARLGIAIEEKPAVKASGARNARAELLFLTGHTFKPPNAAGRIELKSYLAGGGTLLASACCGASTFDETFRPWAEELFGQDKWEQIPADDPIMTGAFAPGLASSLHGLSYRAVPGGGAPARLDWPILYGIRQRGRWMVIYSATDVSSGISRHAPMGCVGYAPIDADAIVTNVLLYATTGGKSTVDLGLDKAPSEPQPVQ